MHWLFPSCENLPQKKTVIPYGWMYGHEIYHIVEKHTHTWKWTLWMKVTILMKLIEWMKFNDVNDVDQDDEISKHG